MSKNFGRVEKYATIFIWERWTASQGKFPCFLDGLGFNVKGGEGGQFMDPDAIRLSAMNAWLHFRWTMQLDCPSWPPSLLAKNCNVPLSPHTPKNFHMSSCKLRPFKYIHLTNLYTLFFLLFTYLFRHMLILFSYKIHVIWKIEFIYFNFKNRLENKLFISNWLID